MNRLLAGSDDTGGQITNPVVGNLGTNQTGLSFFQTFIPRAISFAFVVGVIIFFFMLIFGGIKWISSGGDKQALEGARGTVTSAIIGLVILFATFAVIQLLGTFFGIKILELTIPTLVGP